VVRHHVWAELDERAHYDYIQKVVEEGRLPRPTDLASPETQAINDGTYPRPSPVNIADLGLGGRSYEAMQPPLYYLAVAPAFAVVPEHDDKVYAVRALNLALLLLGVGLLWVLVTRVAPRELVLPGFAVALSVVLWPGTILRSTNIGNTPLEIPLTLGFLLFLWEAERRRRWRPLAIAGGLLGLCLLTKVSLQFLAPLFGLVLVRALLRERTWRAAGARWRQDFQADCTVKWYRTQEYYDSGNWRGTWELDGGGCLMNQGVHGVDLLQWFAGPVAWVQSWCATTVRERIEVETQAIAIVGFKNGAHGVIQGSTVCYPGEPIIHQIFGAKGSASLHDDRLASWNVMKQTAADKAMLNTANDPEAKASGTDPLAALGQPGDTHYPQVRDMVQAIRENRSPACIGEDARHAVEIILAIYESARRAGEKIHLPLQEDFRLSASAKSNGHTGKNTIIMAVRSLIEQERRAPGFKLTRLSVSQRNSLFQIVVAKSLKCPG
jgi:hypothetical protein